MKTLYPISKHKKGLTVLQFLQSFSLGKSKIEKLFQNRQIYINEKVASKETLVEENDVLAIETFAHRDFIEDDEDVDVLYEDDYLLIVNKPAGILVHPDDKSKRNTMCNRISRHYQLNGYDGPIRFVHRLDFDTSGVLIFAKDILTESALNRMIFEHRLQRTYLCLAEGTFSVKKGTICQPIGKDRHQNRRRVSKTGEPATTHYEVIGKQDRYSLVKVRLETGRTHQIRVHFSWMGHPLVGDVLYGSKIKAPRVMLHSYEVRLIHPMTQKNICVLAPLPPEMRHYLKGEKFL